MKCICMLVALVVLAGCTMPDYEEYLDGTDKGTMYVVTVWENSTLYDDSAWGSITLTGIDPLYAQIGNGEPWNVEFVVTPGTYTISTRLFTEFLSLVGSGSTEFTVVAGSYEYVQVLCERL